jgi:hypothetical protein
MILRIRPTRLKQIVSLLTCCCLELFYIVPVLQAQTPQKSEAEIKLATETKQVKERIVKIGLGQDVTIVRRDRQEFYGRIERIEDELVVIYEVDLKANLEIHFEQIKKVSKGYGNSRAWNGKRIPPKKHMIGLIIGIGVLILPIILIANSKD